MPLTTIEALQQLPAVLAFLQKLQEEVSKLPVPPAPRKAEDYGKLTAALAPTLGKLIDDVSAEIND